MRKTLGAVALLLLLAAGVVVNSLRPAPSVKAQDSSVLGVEHNLITENTENGTFSKFSFYVDYDSSYEEDFNSPVILIPSAGREASDFSELTSQLNNKGHSTLSIDLPTLQFSNESQTLSLRDYSETISGTIHLSNKSIIIIGHAYGNRVARQIALENSDKIAGVILLAAGGQVPMPPKAEQSLKNIFNPLRTYRSRMKDVRYAFFAEGNDIPDYWKRGWHTKTAMAQAKAVANSAGDESWHCAGGVPMLIVQPMQDRIAPIENAYALKEKCPQEVTIVEVQNAGHALLPEQPEAVATAVLGFLAKHHPTDKNK